MRSGCTRASTPAGAAALFTSDAAFARSTTRPGSARRQSDRKAPPLLQSAQCKTDRANGKVLVESRMQVTPRRSRAVSAGPAQRFRCCSVKGAA
jgi:hypothetical protein